MVKRGWMLTILMHIDVRKLDKKLLDKHFPESLRILLLSLVMSDDDMINLYEGGCHSPLTFSTFFPS